MTGVVVYFLIAGGLAVSLGVGVVLFGQDLSERDLGFAAIIGLIAVLCWPIGLVGFVLMATVFAVGKTRRWLRK